MTASSQSSKSTRSKLDLDPTYGALPATGFVRLSDLRPILPFSDSTLWRRVRNKTFPAPLKLSEKITCWRAEDVRQWLAEQGQVS